MQDPGLILKEYGADALRLYLINSPVVRAESLRFRQEGVLAVVKDVFLPWYNAYRFLVQNVARMESASQQRFRPAEVCSWCKIDGFKSLSSRALPWYNAYRLLVQKGACMECASQQRFRPAQVQHVLSSSKSLALSRARMSDWQRA